MGGESPGQMFFTAQGGRYGAEIVYRIGEDAEIPQPEAADSALAQQPGGPPAGGPPGARGPRGRRGNGGPQVSFVILDSSGDTLNTLNGPGSPGIHRVYWNFRGQSPEPEEKTPAQVQDSVRSVEGMWAVVDSMVDEGVMERPMLERIATMMISGDREGLFGMFGAMGGGGGGAAPGEFNERPGESWRSGGITMSSAMIQNFRRLVRPLGGSGGFMGRSSMSQPPLAESGDYTVILKVGDEEYPRTLTVEKGPGAAAGGGFFGEIR